MTRISYCQLSIDDELRRRGVNFLNNVFKNEIECAGWGRGLIDGTFSMALRKAIARAGPLIVNMTNRGDDAGDFYDYDPITDRQLRITPEMFWNGIESSRWPGFGVLVNAPPVGARPRASPIYLIVGQYQGQAYARGIREVANSKSLQHMPEDVIITGVSFSSSPSALLKMNEKEQKRTIDADHLEIEEICRLIVRRERFSSISKLKDKLAKLIIDG